MFMLPRPRILFVVSLVLAIPTYGISLLIFYFAFKKPYDSKAVSVILSSAKRSLETGLGGEAFHVNSAAIRRVFSKFSDDEMALKYGVGAVHVQWGVLIHPMINAGKPFSLRVRNDGGSGSVSIEAANGEDWRILKE